MFHRLAEINRVIKAYDRLLFAGEAKLGRIDIMRKSQFDVTPPHYLFSLTDNWRANGMPRDWGLEVILNRLKAHDLWRDDTFVERWIAQHEKDEESKERDRRNSIEAFFYDFRSQFKKTFSDVNTANMKKLYRKEDSHGYTEPRP